MWLWRATSVQRDSNLEGLYQQVSGLGCGEEEEPHQCQTCAQLKQYLQLLFRNSLVDWNQTKEICTLLIASKSDLCIIPVRIRTILVFLYQCREREGKTGKSKNPQLPAAIVPRPVYQQMQIRQPTVVSNNEPDPFRCLPHPLLPIIEPKNKPWHYFTSYPKIWKQKNHDGFNVDPFQ